MLASKVHSTCEGLGGYLGVVGYFGEYIIQTRRLPRGSCTHIIIIYFGT